MKKRSETDIVKEIKDYLTVLGIFHFRVNTTGIFDPTRRVFRTFAGGTLGVSDILGIYGGRFLAIECKMPGKYPSKDQKAFLAQVKASGGIAFVARGIDDVERELAMTIEPLQRSE